MSFLFWFPKTNFKERNKKKKFKPNINEKIKKDQFLHFIGEYFSLICIKKPPKKHFIK